jgi:hypothetical protein
MAEKYDLVSANHPDTPLPCDFVLYHPHELPGIPLVSPEGKSPSVCLEDSLCDPKEQQRFQRIVGSLNYAAHTTRLDVAYAVSQLSRATHSPRKRHLRAAERVVKYLAGTADFGLHYIKDAGAYLECYVDANLAPVADKKSMTGIVIQLGAGPVFWTARKQDRITTSTCDSECLAMQVSTQYVELLRDHLEEFECLQRWPTPVYNDNSAAVTLSKDPRAHHKSVQLVRPMSYIRELTAIGKIIPIHVPTTEQPADFLTKRLYPGPFQACRWLSGMAPLPKDLLTL